MCANDSIDNLEKIPYVASCKGEVTGANRLFCSLTGYNVEEVEHCKIEDLFRNLLRINCDLSSRCLSADDAVYFIFTKDLEPLEVNICVYSGKFEDEKIYCFIKKDNHSIKNNFLFIEKLAKSNNFALALYSVPDLILLNANEKYLSLLNSPYNIRENVIGMKVSEFGRNWDEAGRFWNKIICEGKEYSLKEKRLGDRFWDTTWTPIYLEGKLRYFIVNFVECMDRVMHRKHIEEQTRIISRHNEELEAVIENMNDAIFIYKNGRIYMQNKLAREYYGGNKLVNVGDAYSMAKYYDYQGNELPLERLPGIRLHNGERLENELLIMEIDGHKRYLDINGTPINSDNDDEKYAVMTCREITHLVEKEELIREQQRKLLKVEREKTEALEKALKMKEEFFYTISHEFKTPLTVINAAVQIIETIYDREISEKVKSYIGKIRQNSNRQIRLVNNLLDITRLDCGKVRINKRNIDIIYLTKLIVESVEFYARQKNVNITFESYKPEMVMAIDEEKYERILLNLLSNAIKFTPPNKLIDIRIYERDSYVCIEVKDQGVGIPKDKQQVIFERFGQVSNSLTRQAEGSGIGLSLVKHLIEAFNGKIVLESSEGVGSAFTVMLPSLRIDEEPIEKNFIDSTESRIVEQINIEFSDIYV